MEVKSVPEECLTGTLDIFGGASIVERSLHCEALGDDAQRFASHEESYVVEGFVKLDFQAVQFSKGKVYTGSIPVGLERNFS
jgi:hypothetical protein